MRFSPQRRAIFAHQTFKKCADHEVFCTFWLPNVFFATAACNFSISQAQKALRTWGVLYIFTSKRASRHRGVQLLISPLTTWLRTRRFNRPTFRLTRHTNHWKNTAFHDFLVLTFAVVHLFTSDWTAFLICFSTHHIVGSLLSNFPSVICITF